MHSVQRTLAVTHTQNNSNTQVYNYVQMCINNGQASLTNQEHYTQCLTLNVIIADSCTYGK